MASFLPNTSARLGSLSSLWPWPTNCCQEDTRARDKTSLRSTMMGTEIRPGPGSHNKVLDNWQEEENRLKISIRVQITF